MVAWRRAVPLALVLCVGLALAMSEFPMWLIVVVVAGLLGLLVFAATRSMERCPECRAYVAGPYKADMSMSRAMKRRADPTLDHVWLKQNPATRGPSTRWYRCDACKHEWVVHMPGDPNYPAN